MVDEGRVGSRTVYEDNLWLEGLDYWSGGALPQLFEELELRQEGRDTERVAYFRKQIDDLSKESKEIIGLIFETPRELFDLVDMKESAKKKLTMDDLRDYLRYYGWSYSSINRAFKEIKLFVKSF